MLSFVALLSFVLLCLMILSVSLLFWKKKSRHTKIRRTEKVGAAVHSPKTHVKRQTSSERKGRQTVADKKEENDYSKDEDQLSYEDSKPQQELSLEVLTQSTLRDLKARKRKRDESDDVDKKRKKEKRKHLVPYQKRWCLPLLGPPPTLDFSQIIQLSERGMKNYLLDYYKETYTYRLNFWTEHYIARQARRTAELNRRLHRIRHGGISDNEHKRCHSTHSSLMEVRGNWGRTQMQMAASTNLLAVPTREPDTCRSPTPPNRQLKQRAPKQESFVFHKEKARLTHILPKRNLSMGMVRKSTPNKNPKRLRTKNRSTQRQLNNGIEESLERGQHHVIANIQNVCLFEGQPGAHSLSTDRYDGSSGAASASTVTEKPRTSKNRPNARNCVKRSKSQQKKEAVKHKKMSDAAVSIRDTSPTAKKHFSDSVPHFFPSTKKKDGLEEERITLNKADIGIKKRNGDALLHGMNMKHGNENGREQKASKKSDAGVVNEGVDAEKALT